MAEKNSFVLYTKYQEQINILNDAQAGQLMKAIFAYQTGQEIEISDPMVVMLWSVIRQQLDVDNQKYEEECKKRAEAGAKGARKRWTDDSGANDDMAKMAVNESANEDIAKIASAKSAISENSTPILEMGAMADNDYEYDHDNDHEKDKKEYCTSADAPQKKKAADVQIFEQVWAIYPNKKGKARVSDKSKRAIADIGLDEMTRAIKRYIHVLKQDSWRQPQDGRTFFTSGYVDYLDANYVPPEPKGKPKQASNLVDNFYHEQKDYSYLEE